MTYVGDRESRTVIREHEFSFVEGAVKGGPKASKVRTQENLKFHVLLTSYECINMDKVRLLSRIHKTYNNLGYIVFDRMGCSCC